MSSILGTLTNARLIFRPKRRLFKLFLAGVSRNIAVTFLALFSPVYIYQTFTNLGWEVKQAILFIALFYLAVYLGKLVSLIFAEDLSRSIGFKRTIWLSGVPYIFFIIILFLSLRFPLLVFLAAPFWGFHAGFYWWGFHGYFVKSGDIDHFGEGVGEVDLLSAIASIIAPILGALFASRFGIISPFLLSGVFIITALIFIGLSDDRKQKRDTRISEIVKLLKGHKLISISYTSFQMETSLYIMTWPIFLYIFFGEVVSLGIVVSLGALIAAVFGVVIGRVVDKEGEKRVVSIGAPTLSLSWFVRFIASSMGGFITSDVVRNFGFRLLRISFSELSYRKAVEGGTSNALLFRELSLILGAILSSLLFFIWISFGGGFKTLFIVAGLVAATPLIAVYKRKFHGKKQ